MKRLSNKERKQVFESIYEKYQAARFDGNPEYQIKLNNLSKWDLIRFVNYLHLYIGKVFVDVNDKGRLELFDC